MKELAVSGANERLDVSLESFTETTLQRRSEGDVESFFKKLHEVLSSR